MSREIQVVATWQSFMRTGLETYEWQDIHGGETETLRASLAPKRLTIWLPSGMRVVCRRAWRQIADGKHTDRKFRHSWRDRFGDLQRIVFVIPDDVPLNEEIKV